MVSGVLGAFGFLVFLLDSASRVLGFFFLSFFFTRLVVLFSSCSCFLALSCFLTLGCLLLLSFLSSCFVFLSCLFCRDSVGVWVLILSLLGEGG